MSIAHGDSRAMMTYTYYQDPPVASMSSLCYYCTEGVFFLIDTITDTVLMLHIVLPIVGSL